MADQRFRAFVSYSHDDRAIFDKVCTSLAKRGLKITSDVALKPGRGFNDQIQAGIAHAHVFVPILTPRSHPRGWVHQEIGFAVAMRIPYVPICVGELPDGMIAMSQAIVVSKGLAGLDNKISRVDFAGLVEHAGRDWAPPARVAPEPEDRSRMIQELAEAAFSAEGAGRVRIAGGLSSFSLPDEEPNHPKWTAAYGDRPRSVYSYRWTRSECDALKKHIGTAGLSMIVNAGLDLDKQRGPGVTRTRLCLLNEFLRSTTVSDELTEIVVLDEYPADLFLAVGDWFFAESRSPRAVAGVLHTTFITYAPIVGRRIAEFDQNLSSLLRSEGVSPEKSRIQAIGRIEKRIRELPRHPAWSCSG
jgi:hypothetical protein